MSSIKNIHSLPKMFSKLHKQIKSVDTNKYAMRFKIAIFTMDVQFKIFNFIEVISNGILRQVLIFKEFSLTISLYFITN